MAETTTPTLRVVKGGTEADIDTVNRWMRVQPWYQQLLQSFGVNPLTGVKLNEQQRQAVVQAAQQHGIAVDEGNIEVDPAGNFNPKGHKLRNTLIVAGIAGATLATMGAAGAFSGAAAGGAGGSTAALGPATAANIAATGAVGAAPAGIAAGTGSAAAASGGGLFSKLLSGVGGKGGLVNAGLNLGANLVASHQTSKAADAQLAATKDALGLQKSIYDQTRADQAPWLQAGQGASNKLSYLLGLPMGGGPPNAAAGTPAPGMAPSGARPMPSGSPLLGTAMPRQQPQLVTVQAPDGEVRQLPSELAAQAEQRGAKILNSALLGA